MQEMGVNSGMREMIRRMGRNEEYEQEEEKFRNSNSVGLEMLHVSVTGQGPWFKSRTRQSKR